MKLSQSFDARFVRRFKLHQRIGQVLFKTPRLNALLRKISGMMLSVLEDADRWRQRLEYSDVRERGNADEHGYDKKYGDLSAALSYALQIEEYDKGLHEQGEGKVLYQRQLETMRRLLESERPKRVLNFGVCFAYVDAILAREFPDTEFVGIDLSVYNKAFNEAAFSDVPNLKILAGEYSKSFVRAITGTASSSTAGLWYCCRAGLFPNYMPPPLPPASNGSSVSSRMG